MNKLAGFTLVELLVSIVVVSIGLIGLAAMQLQGLRSNQIAFNRSIATELAYDIADRMNANPVGVKNLSYHKVIASSASDCQAGACNPAEMALYDLAQWNQALAASLPNGTGIVCLVSSTAAPTLGTSDSPTDGCAGAGQIYVIKIWWDDDRSGNLAQGFMTSFEP